MTPDNLDTLSDAELNECFAVEVAGWKRANPEETRERYQHWLPPGKQPVKNIIYTARPESFSTDANAVLPWLEKDGIWECVFVGCRGGYAVSVGHGPDSEARTFARAACIALIRAKRSTTPKA